MAMLFAKIEQTIRKYDLINPGDKILVALSGGPDSVLLFHALNFLAPKLGVSVSAAHIDHGLRKSAAGDRRFCIELCKLYGVKLHSKIIDITAMAKKRRMGVEECGRSVRYEYFEQLCLKHGYNKTATGHTSDDCAETFLMNLVRGANLGGLSGILIKRANIIRPLLECSKSELLAFLKQNGLSYRIDESNLGLKYRRNLIRHKIIPQLARINPAASGHIAAAAEAIGQNYLFTQQIIDEVFKQCTVEQGSNQIILDLTRLSGYYKSLGSWVFLKAYSLLSGEHYRPDAEIIARILRLNRNGSLIPLGPEIAVIYHDNKLFLIRTMKKFARCSLKLGALTILGHSGMAIVSETTGNQNYSEIINNRDENQAFVDYAKVSKPEVRNLKAGDKFKPLGMIGTKKLVDFLNEKGVPRQAKAVVPIVVSGNKIVWVAGFGIADDVKVTKDTRKILKLRLLKNEQNTSTDFQA
jgi:tRNA(Ile)-lysidine synthase